MIDGILNDLSLNEQLRTVIAFADQPGIEDDFFSKIEEIVQKGADINVPFENDKTALTTAVEDGKPRVVKELIRLGADLNQKSGEGYSPWTTHLLCVDIPHMEEAQDEIRHILTEAGADISEELSLEDLIEHTEPDYIVVPSSAEPTAEIENVNPKWSSIIKHGTNGINSDVDTQEVIDTLEAWDKQFGIEISEVGHDRVTVDFENISEENSYSLANEINEFCPDVIDQGFGCMDDMLKLADEHGIPLDENTLKLIEGVDFSNDDFGLELLRRSLFLTKQVALWWD